MAKQCAHTESKISVIDVKTKRMIMSTPTVKEEAERLIRDLPEDATWDDLMQKIYVRQAIEAGLEDSTSGRTMDVKEVREKFGLSP